METLYEKSDKRAALPQLTASYSPGKLNGRHADILVATIPAKMSVSGSVSVSVPWNSSFIAHGIRMTPPPLATDTHARYSPLTTSSPFNFPTTLAPHHL